MVVCNNVSGNIRRVRVPSHNLYLAYKVQAQVSHSLLPNPFVISVEAPRNTVLTCDFACESSQEDAVSSSTVQDECEGL